MLKIIKVEKEGYALILKSQDEPLINKDKSVPKEVQKLLEEYKEVVAKYLPSFLPPIRDISHQIDFIPRASLPNKAPYKLTPAQNAKISKQVIELLEKGLIQKSLIPCVVPSFLAPNKDGTWKICIEQNYDTPYPPTQYIIISLHETHKHVIINCIYLLFF